MSLTGALGGIYMEEFHKGQVKETKGQTKWLFSKLSVKQQAKVMELAKQMNVNTDFSLHVLSKVKQGQLEFDTVLLESMLGGNYSVIELNKTGRFTRVLLRSIECTKHQIGNAMVYVNLCVVYQPHTNTIVTMYYNDISDTHISLDMKRYK